MVTGRYYSNALHAVLGVLLVACRAPSFAFEDPAAHPSSEHCADGRVNAGETDVDCGGRDCSPCPPDSRCAQDSDCTSELCAAGACTEAACDDGRRNGSETDVDCGGGACAACATGDHCRSDGDCAGGVCTSGLCQLLCLVGKADCNGDVSDGCEADLEIDDEHCGACSIACQASHTMSNSCAAGLCVPKCAAGFSDCDGDTSTGCEQRTADDPANCGGCNVQCQSSHASSVSCAGGSCQPTCEPGWAACGSPEAGCSSSLDSVKSCGGCGVVCAGETPLCVNRACSSHRDIVLVNTSTTGTSVTTGETLAMAHALASAAGSYRAVAVLLGAQIAEESDAPVSVTYGGAPMTRAIAEWSGTRAWAGIYYLLDRDLPSTPGQYSVIVNPGSGTSSFALAANVIEATGVDQVVPLDVASSNSGLNCASMQPVASAAVGGAGELVLAIASLFGSGATNTTVQASGQTTTLQVSTAAAFGVLGGFELPVSSPLSIGWNATSCNNWGEAVVSFLPASHG